MESRRIKILAIDDNPDNLVTIKALIMESFPDALILSALTGTKGFELAAAEDPDVILLDIVMPIMDGFEVCKKLKTDEKLSNIPVVFVTAIKGDKESRIKALECGAEAFLAKPIDESELTAQVRAMVKIKTANIEKLTEKERLAALVTEQTRELKANHQATLNLLEDLRKENEVRLKSEEKYRMFIDLASDAFFQGDKVGNFIEVNNSAVELTGYNRGELLRMNMKDLFSEDENKSKPLKYNLLDNGETVKIERKLIRKDDRTIFVDMNSKKLPDGTYQSFIRDITDRKQVETQLQLLNQRFTLYIQNSPLAFIEFDLEGRVQGWNPAAVEIFGYSREEAIGQYWTFIVPQEIWSSLDDNWGALLRQKGGIRSSNLNTTKNGQQISCEWYNAPLVDPGGKIFGVASLVMDITERKQAAENLQKSYDLLNKLTAQVPGVVYQYRLNLDGSSAFPYSSPGMYDIYEVTPNEVREDASPVFSRIHPDDYDNIVETISESARNQTFYHSEFRVILPKQGLRWRLCNAKPERLEDGSTLWYGIISDITERKNSELLLQVINEELIQTNEELVIAKEHAEESDRLKSAFLANMSHEIRTPMNGILGFAGLLKEPKLSGEQQEEYIAIIEKSGTRMLNIINDIITISKVESGQMNTLVSETSVNEQIEFVYTFFKPEVEQKGMHLYFRNSLTSKEAIIKTDKEKVYSILTNLVKNAIKYSDTGTIEIGYNLVETQCIASLQQQPVSLQLQFYVKDTGIGIPIDRQKAIFDRFVQADIGDIRAFQGAGLGLSISKAYVEMLGGRIWLESEEGKGSTFYFTIPYNGEHGETKIIKNIVMDKGVKNQTNPENSGLKILIAEDDETSGMLIEIAVKGLSKEILKARTGIEAVETCRNHQDIDFVLMDIKMPGIDGYEATKQIRKFNSDVIIIAQTAYALIGDREKALQAGCNDYIAKPFGRATLTAIIEKHLKKGNVLNEFSEPIVSFSNRQIVELL